MSRMILAVAIGIPILWMAAANPAKAHLKSRDYFKTKWERPTGPRFPTNSLKLPAVQTPYKLPAVQTPR